MALTTRGSARHHGAALSPITLDRPVKAGAKIQALSLVVGDSDGMVKPGVTGTGLVTLGRAEFEYDNTAGADGAIVAKIHTGVYDWANSSGGDEIDAGDLGSTCYVVDDDTVALTDGSGTRSPAGTVVGMFGSRVLVASSPLLPITGSDGPFPVRSVSRTFLHGAITATPDTDNTNYIGDIGDDLPAGATILGRTIHLVTPFSGGGSTSLSLFFGGTDADGIVSAFDCFGSAAGYYDGTSGATPTGVSYGGQQLTGTLNPDGSTKTSDFTAGEVKVTVYYVDATDA